MNIKLCAKCNSSKQLDEFYKDKASYRKICKTCCCAIKRSKYLEKSDLIKHKAKLYYALNRDVIQLRQKQYNSKNKTIRNNYRKQKLKEDVNFKLMVSLRNRLNLALKRSSKSGSAVKDLGCSISKLKIHLQLLFYRNYENNECMTWDNYGAWHIDHIKPLSSFNLTDIDQFKKACHYKKIFSLCGLKIICVKE